MRYSTAAATRKRSSILAGTRPAGLLQVSTVGPSPNQRVPFELARGTAAGSRLGARLLDRRFDAWPGRRPVCPGA